LRGETHQTEKTRGDTTQQRRAEERRADSDGTVADLARGQIGRDIG